jgi:glutamate-1-semialdehyde 2,1-aminomutase
MEMQKRAKRRIPGMTQLLSKRPDMFAPGSWPGYFSKAKGAEVWDLDGNKYTDMSLGGIGANVLGYADPDVDAAVCAAIKAGSSSTLNCAEEVELAELLCDIHPWAQMVKFARTGGEAMAVAVRIARANTRRDKIAFCGYHGWHDWYLAANLGTENALGEHHISGLNPLGVPKGLQGTALPFRYNHLDELEKIVRDNSHDLAAIVMEPIRSEQPQPGFLEGVKALAEKVGAVFIFDEISSGFRLNSGGAHLLFNIVPDIAVFSKALGNGYPIAAIIGRADVMEVAQDTFISSTMWTERVGPAAAIAMINKHRQFNVADHLVKIGTQVQEGWKKAAGEKGLEIKTGGIPPLSHFSFEYDNALSMKALFVKLMLQKGFLASTVFYSMFAHSDEQMISYLKSVEEAFAGISSAHKAGTIEELIGGRPSASGFRRLA